MVGKNVTVTSVPITPTSQWDNNAPLFKVQDCSKKRLAPVSIVPDTPTSQWKNNAARVTRPMNHFRKTVTENP